MTTRHQIEHAFSSHALWRVRLRDMCLHKQITQSLAEIAADDQCEFGRWLYSNAISDAERGSPIFLLVKKKHTDFHCAAADVAQSVIAGDGDRAEQMLASEGQFSRASAALVDALMHWRSQLSDDAPAASSDDK
jgi:hypothetical protein